MRNLRQDLENRKWWANIFWGMVVQSDGSPITSQIIGKVFVKMDYIRNRHWYNSPEKKDTLFLW